MITFAVFVNGVRAGTLRQSHEGSFFELDEGYLSIPRRPVLGQIFEDNPNTAYWTRQGIPSWFANLLPEGPLRTFIAERAGVNEHRSLFLLGLLGEDLPGAVVVRPVDSDEEYEEIESQATEGDSEFLFSLAGVQLKFSAIQGERSLTIPVHGRGGDWIVKLPDERFDGVPENEYTMLELARHVGINVPQARLVDVNEISGLPEKVVFQDSALAVQRFDRTTSGDRVHIEDFAQVLDIKPEDKYRSTNFDTIARVTAAICGDDDVDELIRRLVFMIAIGNSDAHVKNWSLIYPDGRMARLAPAYDLVAVSAYENIETRLRPRLALRLAKSRLADAVTENTFRTFSKRAKLDEERVITVVGRQVETILREWPEFAATWDGPLNPHLKQTIDDRLERLPLFKAT